MGIRLNKYIADSGYCSRRQADKLISENKVTINDNIACIGQMITENDVLKINGEIINQKKSRVILLFNKPRGIVCTTATNDKRNLVDFLGLDYRVFMVGRLDKDSEGLLLLTDDGDIVNKIMRARYAHEKEYIVRVNKKINQAFIKKMSSGVHIVDAEKGIDTVTRKCKCTLVDDTTFNIVLTQGINRQIRRMCSALDVEVISLKRIRIMNLSLGDIKTGEYRAITESEKRELYGAIKENNG